jgi:hypothetical protein
MLYTKATSSLILNIEKIYENNNMEKISYLCIDTALNTLHYIKNKMSPTNLFRKTQLGHKPYVVTKIEYPEVCEMV